MNKVLLLERILWRIQKLEELVGELGDIELKAAAEAKPKVRGACPHCGQLIKVDRKTYMREYMRTRRAKKSGGT
jgi:hypothetical protein